MLTIIIISILLCLSYVSCQSQSMTLDEFLRKEFPETTKVFVPEIHATNASIGCGKRNELGVGYRISGDEFNEAQFGEYPWNIVILKEENGTHGETINKYICGGSLIDPGVILTAAHCLNGRSPQVLKIRAGEWDLELDDEVIPHQERQISDFVVHPDYHRGALHNDIALLFLSEPFYIADNVNVICLPFQNEKFDQKRCIVAGWGRNSTQLGGAYQTKLKMVDLPIVSRESCLSSIRQSMPGRKEFNLHESFICAGGEIGKSACKGDGGSPLVCPIKDKPDQYVQAGIVSWGTDCGTQSPGVYVNVPLFIDWINEKIIFH